MLVGPVRDRLQQLMQAVADEYAWTIIRLAIQPDQVHLCLRADPYTLPADSARLINGRSSHDVRQEFPHRVTRPSRWTRSCLLATAGTFSQAIMQKYLDRQSNT